MSRTAENLYVRGCKIERVVAAVEKRLRGKGLVRVADSERAAVERTEPELLRIALRRDGPWIAVADSRGFGGFGQRADGDLEGWGRDLSRELDRSVLTIWTWDGEGFVTATRYKREKKRGALELPRAARRGDDGVPRAPAKILWPWLPKSTREASLRDGFALVERATGTGDAELDALLEGFDDDVGDAGEEDEEVVADGDDGAVHVSMDTCVAALGAAIGLTNPSLNPHDDEEAQELLFKPVHTKGRRG